MSTNERAWYYRALKNQGYVFDKPFVSWTTAELKKLWEEHGDTPLPPEPEPVEEAAPTLPPRQPNAEMEELRSDMAQLAATVRELVALQTQQQQQTAPAAPILGETQPLPTPPPPGFLDPNEHAGLTLNTHAEDEVLEVDEFGNEWYRREVAKPGFPKPRGRRVYKYADAGTSKERIDVGDGYYEEFEISGSPKNARPSEIHITLPSHQTGVYRSPNMPFRIHTYQGVRGFNMQDVDAFYGGRDLVPSSIKRMYVSMDMCYDIRTTIRTIEDEYSERVLKKGKR